MPDYDRREIIRLVTCSSLALSLTACPKEQEQAVRAAIPAAAYIAVEIGERVAKFPHPAAKILGIILILAGTASEIAVELMRTDGPQERASIPVTIDEAQAIQAAKKVSLIKQDGTKEGQTFKEEYK